MNMLIKSSCYLEFYDTYVIKIHTLLTTVLILIFGIIAHPRYSFLTERLHLNLDKGEVMHNEETT